MNQYADKYERLVAFAGWLWMRIRDGKAQFRRSDLATVAGLEYLGESSAASRKAFERAAEALETFGVDIEWDKNVVNKDDPLISGAYRVSGLKLTPQQRQALLGLAFTIAYRDLATDVALRIPGSFLEGAGDTLLLDANRQVAPVSEAIDERMCITFAYKDGVDRRDVQPLHLGFQRGTWYLAAYEFASSMTKNFRLDGIREVDESGHAWDDAHDTDEARSMVLRARDRFYWGDESIKQLVLAVDPDAELAARRLLAGMEEVAQGRDGRLLLTREYSNDENMLDAVLTLGLRAEVIEPPELRQSVVDHLSAMVGSAS